ncbi:MAG: dockerin type I repeat-containing protein [Clostridiales bacterium]|nr:dockerin type I repeat-containing protein [Clostridiales bacterium]
MKKLLTLFLVLAFLFALAPATSILAAEAPLKHGDANGDGKLDASDAALILRHLAGLITLEGAQLAAANADGQGDVTAADAALVLRHLAGLAVIPDWVEQPDGLTISEAYEMVRGMDVATKITRADKYGYGQLAFTPSSLSDFEILTDSFYRIYLGDNCVGYWDEASYKLTVWNPETYEDYFSGLPVETFEAAENIINSIFGVGEWIYELPSGDYYDIIIRKKACLGPVWACGFGLDDVVSLNDIIDGINEWCPAGSWEFVKWCTDEGDFYMVFGNAPDPFGGYTQDLLDTGEIYFEAALIFQTSSVLIL